MKFGAPEIAALTAFVVWISIPLYMEYALDRWSDAWRTAQLIFSLSCGAVSVALAVLVEAWQQDKHAKNKQS